MVGIRQSEARNGAYGALGVGVTPCFTPKTKLAGFGDINGMASVA